MGRRGKRHIFITPVSERPTPTSERSPKIGPAGQLLHDKWVPSRCGMCQAMKKYSDESPCP